MEKMYISYKITYADDLTKKNINKLLRRFEIESFKDVDFIKKTISARSRVKNIAIIRKSFRLIINNLIMSIKLNQNLVISLDDNVLRDNGLNHKIFSAVVEQIAKFGLIDVVKGKAKQRTEIKANESFKDFIIGEIFKLAESDGDGYYQAIVTDVRFLNNPNESTNAIRISYAVNTDYYYQLIYINASVKALNYWRSIEDKINIGSKAKIKVKKTSVTDVKF